MRRRLLAAWPLVLAASAVAWPATSHASADVARGAGAACFARVGQCSAAVPGDAAPAHNPAGVVSAPPAVRLGLMGALHAPRWERQPCDGCVRPAPPASQQALVAGWSGALGPTFGLGVSVSTPVGALVHVRAADPRRAHHPMLVEPSERFGAHVALAWRPTPWLDVGLGAQAHARIGSDLVLRLRADAQQVTRSDVTIHLGPALAATAGARVRLPQGWRVGLAWRQGAQVDYTIRADASVADAVAIDALLGQPANLTPSTVSVGVAHEGRAWGIEAGLRVALWRSAAANAPHLLASAGGDVASGLGLDGERVARDTPGRWYPALNDTWSPALSVWRRALGSLTMRAGWRWRPSPLPQATPTAALLDNHRHELGAGLDLRLGRWQLRLAGQLHLLQERPSAAPGVASHGGTSVLGMLDIVRRL